MKSRLIVSAVIKKSDKFLFGRKADGIGPYPNTWHLLGGGVNLGKESLKEALVREIKEEAGIEIADIKKLSFDEDYEPDKKGELTHYIFLVFEANYQSGELKPDDDIKELKWFNKSEITNLSLPKPSINLFQRLFML
ncbi:MAG: NUDIX domain-containing protein [Patescibacteria group bacterium]|nr:NUDIX domain-containing protein [Actinomycetota bacterium]MCL5438499.1 NUDIX domain-containing protein [Patescibacteria group bacterium]